MNAKNFFMLGFSSVALFICLFLGFAANATTAADEVLTYESMPAQLPEEYRNYAPGSVQPVIFDTQYLKQVTPGDVISLSLPIGQENIICDSLKNEKNGDVTWVGHMEDNEAFRTILTIGEKEVTGQIATPDEIFSVRTKEGHIWLVDTADTNQPSVDSHDHVTPGGKLVERRVPPRKNIPAIHMALFHPIFLEGRPQFVSWKFNGINPNTPAIVIFSKDRKKFFVISKWVPIKKRNILWTPHKWDVTGSGILGVCAKKPGKAVKYVCGLANIVVKAKIPPPPPPPPHDGKPPTVPAGLFAKALSPNAVKLSWLPSKDNVGVVGYQIFRNGTLIAGIVGTSYTDTGLTPNTFYKYAIMAYDKAKNASHFAYIHARTLAPAPPPKLSTVDLMIYHTPDISSTRVNFLVALTNQALKNSGVALRMRVVSLIPVAYSPAKLNVEAISDLRFGHGVFANVNVFRAKAGADLVTFIRSFSPNQVNCGISYLNGMGGAPLSASDGFSVVSDGGPCYDTTLAHELGHTMGLAHDREHSLHQKGVLPYSYGYCVHFKAGDLMGVCGATSVALYSNPKLVVNGVPLGVSKEHVNSADNASALNAVRQIVANFMPTKQP